jgi:GNAT superfamily N-acetyltransferase
MVIRPANAEDPALLARIIVAAFEDYRDSLDPPSAALWETEASIAAELAAGAGAFIVEEDGAAAGCVMTRRKGADLYLGRLAVLATVRGRGLGRALIAAAEEAARREGLAGACLNVRIALPKNRLFFNNLGYVETGREAHPGFDRPTFITMRKQLA